MSDRIVSSIKTLDWQALLNRGLQYGDGLFETMLLIDGVIPLWEYHWNRLQISAKKLCLSCPDEAIFINHIEQLTGTVDARQVVIKLTLFRQSQSRGYLAQHKDSDWVLQASPLVKSGCGQSEEKLTLKLGLAKLKLAEQPELAGMKHLNRLEQVFLARELHQSTFDELLVCSQQGHVIESVSQNLVLIKGDELFTPDTSQCGVAGVGLAWLKSQFKVTDLEIQPSDLKNFDMLFLINSIRGVTSVSFVEGVKKFSTESLLHDRINLSWNELIDL